MLMGLPRYRGPIETVEQGGRPPLAVAAEAAAALHGPDTIDCIAPAASWAEFWTEGAAAKRRGAAWLGAAEAAPAELEGASR